MSCTPNPLVATELLQAPVQAYTTAIRQIKLLLTPRLN